MTERVVPLSWQVKRRSLSEETAKWGVYTVAVGGGHSFEYVVCMLIVLALSLQSTLRFINEDASSVHGIVRASSIYTSESGEWKLGGFDILSSMKDDDAIIYVSPPSHPTLGPNTISEWVKW